VLVHGLLAREVHAKIVFMIPLTLTYARLEALRSNLPEGLKVEEKYVTEFHGILSLLEKASGADLTVFRVPGEELKRRITSANPGAGTVGYSDSKFCERSFLMMKVQGVLGFFTLELSSPKPAMGFVPPPKER